MTGVATMADPQVARSAEFFVCGTPQQKGSTKSWYNPRAKRIVTVSDNDKLKFWESNVRTKAGGEWQGAPSDGSVRVDAMFFFERPQSHYGTGRNAGRLKDSAPQEHLKCPDLDKLVRGLLDGMTEVVFKDDRQVISITAEKRYLTPAVAPARIKLSSFLHPRAGHGPGALITVCEV